jgi:hypothetical protein
MPLVQNKVDEDRQKSDKPNRFCSIDGKDAGAEAELGKYIMNT